MKSVVSAHTTKNDRLAEEERMFDILFGNILGNGTNNENTAANANDSNDDDVDRTITSTGNDTWVTINSNGTDATPVTAAASTSPSVVSPLDKSIVSPPLLSTSVDESLANDLASAMAYALNMPTARQITEVLQDMYILPDYRMHSDEEPCSDADDYSTSSSEYEYARRQRMPFPKKNGNAVVLGRRRRSQFRSSRTKKSTRTTDKNTANRVQSKNKSKGKEVSASKKKVRGPSLSKKNDEDKMIGLRILFRKKATQKDKNTKGGVPKTKTVRKMLKQKTPMNHGSVSDEGNAANFGFVIPGLACVTSSSPSTSIDASDTNDLGPDIDDFITSYGLTVEKTIADIKSAVDTVKFSDANDMAYAILGRPTPPEVSPSSINKNGKRDSSKPTTSKSKKKKRGAATSSKKKKSVKIELLGSSRTPSPPTEDGTCNGSERRFVTWSQKKLKASSLFIKSIPTARSKHGIGPQRTLFKFNIGRRLDHSSGPGDFEVATGPRAFLRLGQRNNDPRGCDQQGSDPATTAAKHAKMSAETNIDSDDEMINHRARITVTKPSSAVPFDPDNNLLNISTDTPIEINCKKRLSKASGVSTKGGINDEEGTDDGAANVQAKPSIERVDSKWTKPRALFQSPLSKISKASSSLVGGGTTSANANATEVPAQMNEELLVKIAELADELYDDALTPSMSILRATKIIERHPENIEEIVVVLERRVKEKHSASADMTETAATPKKMPNSLDLTPLTDATEALSSPDISPSSKGGSDVLANLKTNGVGMGDEIGIEVNLSAAELDKSAEVEPEDHIDVEMNISLSSNGVEIYFDIDTDEIKSNLKNEQFLRELSAKLELYMRLEALYGKAETEEHAQCRLQAVLERFQGREQIVLLALRRQMEILALEEELQVDNHNERRRSLAGVHSQPCFGDNTNAGMCEARNDDLVAEQSKSPVTKTNSIEEPIQEETCSSNMKSSKVGIDELSADDDLYDADISADLDNLLRGTVEI